MFFNCGFLHFFCHLFLYDFRRVDPKLLMDVSPCHVDFLLVELKQKKMFIFQ